MSKIYLPLSCTLPITFHIHVLVNETVRPSTGLHVNELISFLDKVVIR